MIQLVIFDLGRVMVRLVDGWRHACEIAGVPYRSAYDAPEMRDALVRLAYQNEIGRMDHDAWARATAELTGLTPAQASAVSRAWLAGPYPGWDALLDQLAETPVRTACLSNTNATHWEQMNEPGGRNELPLRRLNYRFASHLIGAHKPEPAIYEHVERVSGVKPAAILFFDDAAPNIEGARLRGWNTELVAITGDPVEQVMKSLRRHGVL